MTLNPQFNPLNPQNPNIPFVRTDTSYLTNGFSWDTTKLVTDRGFGVPQPVMCAYRVNPLANYNVSGVMNVGAQLLGNFTLAAQNPIVQYPAGGATVFALDCPRSLALTFTTNGGAVTNQPVTLTVNGYDQYFMPLTMVYVAVAGTAQNTPVGNSICFSIITNAQWSVPAASNILTVTLQSSLFIGLPFFLQDPGCILSAYSSGLLLTPAQIEQWISTGNAWRETNGANPPVPTHSPQGSGQDARGTFEVPNGVFPSSLEITYRVPTSDANSNQLLKNLNPSELAFYGVSKNATGIANNTPNYVYPYQVPQDSFGVQYSTNVNSPDVIFWNNYVKLLAQ
jgi:hypothetical protein